MTGPLDVSEGDYIKYAGHWREIRRVELLFRSGDLHGWFITTDAGRHDMFAIDAFLTREEFTAL